MVSFLRGSFLYFYPRSPCGERRLEWSGIIAILNFYPRSPCGERPPPIRDVIQWEGIFLSTLSLRRATSRAKTVAAEVGNFYPRSPCGERHPEKSESLTTYFISIHALLAESDEAVAKYGADVAVISIHALLAESDGMFSRLLTAFTHFYPRSPCGERRL